MTTLFHARLSGRFMVMESNIRGKKLSRAIVSFNLLLVLSIVIICGL